MAFHVTRRQGDMIGNPDESTMDDVLAELDGPDDPEHPDVSLTHASEWCLSAFPSGLVVWENAAEGEAPVKHMRHASREDVRRLWAELALGRIKVVDAEDWAPGYGGTTR